MGRSVQEIPCMVVALVPGYSPVGCYLPGKSVADFDAGAEVVILRDSAGPSAASVPDKADLTVFTQQPARPDVDRQIYLIEFAPRVFLSSCVAAHAQPQAIPKRVLILAPGPYRDAHP